MRTRAAQNQRRIAAMQRALRHLRQQMVARNRFLMASRIKRVDNVVDRLTVDERGDRSAAGAGGAGLKAA